MSAKQRFIWYGLGIIALAVVVVAIVLAVQGGGVTVSAQSGNCIDCHTSEGIQTAQIAEWQGSRHADKGVGCFECHQAAASDRSAYEHYDNIIATIVSPIDCARCHEKEFVEFDGSHHAKAGEILGSADNFLGEAVEGVGASVQGCQYCHGSVVKVLDGGKLDASTWPNLGIGRLNPDGSKGTCSGCHSKHAFSPAVARSPDACGKCHMGPDHPQKEIFDESKHGINYYAHMDDMNLDATPWILGEEYTQAPNCVTCHMGGTRDLKATHDLGTRLSWNLRAIVSKPMADAEQKRANMELVCANCHGPEWYGNFYKQLDATVAVYNDNFAIPATEIMAGLRERGALTATQFDEEIEWIYFELWHHEGRRARHGAAMMGPDYVQWHGFYEIAQHFYFKFLPAAEELGAGAAIEALLDRPEHQWIKGIKPDGLRLQEEAFSEWRAIRDAGGE